MFYQKHMGCLVYALQKRLLACCDCFLLVSAGIFRSLRREENLIKQESKKNAEVVGVSCKVFPVPVYGVEMLWHEVVELLACLLVR